MNLVVIALFCVIPMLAWIATLWAMKGYTLTGAKMKEIQAINAATGIMNACKKTKAFANRRSIKRLVRLIIYSLTAIMLDKFNR